MSKLTTHALDTYSGTPAKGMKVDVYFVLEKREKIKSVILNNDGREDEVIVEPMKMGNKEVMGHVGDYCEKRTEWKDRKFLNEDANKVGNKKQ